MKVAPVHNGTQCSHEETWNHAVVPTWVELLGMRLGKLHQIEKEKSYMLLLICH